MKVLYERAVAYLNVDYAVDYNYVLYAGTSPLLQDSLYEATKLVSVAQGVGRIQKFKERGTTTNFLLWSKNGPDTSTPSF